MKDLLKIIYHIQGPLIYPRGYVPGSVADIGIADNENYFPIGINGNRGG